MTDTILPVQLNKGLDLVTSPLLTEAGALIDCLNYELTDLSGYRRIDGYERFDGYPDGELAEYYELTIVATDPADQVWLTAGSILGILVDIPPDVVYEGDATTEDIGAVVGTGTGTNVYRYVPFDSITEVTDGTAIKVRRPDGIIFNATITVAPVNGMLVDTDIDVYLANVRNYASIMRALVEDAPSEIAGMWRLDDNLYAAVNAQALTLTLSDLLTNTTYPVPGSLVSYEGIIYKVLAQTELPRTDSPAPGLVRFAVVAVDTTAAFSTNVNEVTSTGTIVTLLGSGHSVSSTGEYAYVVKYNDVRTSTTRGHTMLAPIVRIPFDTGSHTAETFTLGQAVDVGDAGFTKTISGILRHVQIDSGSFLSGNAAGYMHVELSGSMSGGTRILDNYEIRLDVTTVIGLVNTPSSATLQVEGPLIAGTYTLEVANTRYVAIQGNFTGSLDTRAAYATNGVTRAVWNTPTGFGTVKTNTVSEYDNPKYVAMHVGKLALGFAQGSVILSVQGEPLNYSGEQGAIEIATGDPVTGLLEMPGHTLTVFGKRAIRKITGYTDVDTTLGSLAVGASCYDYTAVLVGQTAVYTGVHGITSLEQSASYGDFVGQRLSHNIATWLRPRLVTTYANIESGGIACAIPVRTKQQYRLFLKTGEVVILTLTNDGPRITMANYGLDGEVRVPFAWSSDTLDNGQELIHVRWDTTGLEQRTYSLDKGWGFDGETFQHYFDVSHVFNKNGVQYSGIERLRMFGLGYGIATLNVKSSGIEEDFDQEYHTRIQDISMPSTPNTLYDRMKPVTSIVDQENWGTGIKLRICNTMAEGLTTTEPSHICQILVLHLRTEGAGDT